MFYTYYMFIIVVLDSLGLDFRCMAWACHGHGMHGMAEPTRIESRRGARGRGDRNFAGKTMALQAKKSEIGKNPQIGNRAWWFRIIFDFFRNHQARFSSWGGLIRNIPDCIY